MHFSQDSKDVHIKARSYLTMPWPQGQSLKEPLALPTQGFYRPDALHVTWLTASNTDHKQLLMSCPFTDRPTPSSDDRPVHIIMFSIQEIRRLLQFLTRSTRPIITLASMLSCSILITCPKYHIFRDLIRLSSSLSVSAIL